MSTVVLLGTMDTKGLEYDYVRRRIHEAGCDTMLVDAGILGQSPVPVDVSRDDVARAAGVEIAGLIAGNDRGAAVEAMARGATVIVGRLFADGGLHGIVGLGGSGGTTLVTQAMRALPFGVPKMMVSTVASGDTRQYVGAADIAMLHSVVDIAGINRLSARILSNAGAAIAGMARAYANFSEPLDTRPLIATTMFGVTTPCVTVARQRLEELGYEVLVFHAVGTGGQSMEALASGGALDGVLDITTTELADELVGGVFSAGPGRLDAVGAHGVPQVVSLGALDMVNFGSIESVPTRFRGRTLYQHNPTVTLMRTTAEECAQLGRIIAEKLNRATGPVALYIPLRGVSMIATEGNVFYDPAADQALIASLKEHLRGNVEMHELDLDINDARFARAMADRLDRYVRA